jgi:hypothetical protein
MLNLEHPNRLMIVAVCMMLFGCIVPFLMILKVVESTLFMNFLSFTVSTLGLFLGIVGIAVSRGRQNKKDDEENWEK